MGYFIDILGYLGGSFGIIAGTGDYRVRLRFDPWAAQLVRERSYRVLTSNLSETGVFVHRVALDAITLPEPRARMCERLPSATQPR